MSTRDPYIPYRDTLMTLFELKTVDALMSGTFESENDFNLCAERMGTGADSVSTQIFLPSVFRDSAIDTCVPLPELNVREWTSLAKVIDFYGIQNGTLFLLPIFWQTEFMFHAAVRALGLPMYLGHIKNIPLTCEVVRKTEIDFAVVDRATLPLFLDILTRRKKPHQLVGILQVIPYDELITHCRAGGSLTDIPTTNEVHVVPGYPILTQEPVFLNKVQTTFIMSKEYIWEIIEDETYITACTNTALPVCRFKLPFVIRKLSDTVCEIVI